MAAAKKQKTHKDCTAKEDAFAREVALSTLTLEQCFLKAGYSSGKSGNRQTAYKTLQKPYVLERVEYYKSMMAAKLDIRAERIMAEYAAIAFLDPLDVFEITGENMTVKSLDDIPTWARRAIMSIKTKKTVNTSHDGDDYETTEVEVKFHPKVAALTKLAEIKNLFEDNNKSRAPRVTFDVSMFNG